jgi:hypothetical protein
MRHFELFLVLVHLGYQLLRYQRRRSFAPERNQAIAEEVKKPYRAGFIKEVNYPEWLANIVLVK